jgi:hypothetical protein
LNDIYKHEIRLVKLKKMKETNLPPLMGIFDKEEEIGEN